MALAISAALKLISSILLLLNYYHYHLGAEAAMQQQPTRMSLRQQLLRGGKSYGPFVLSDSPIVAELLSLAGYGHIVIDHEHGPTDVRSGQVLLQAMQASSFSNTEAIVRLPSPNDPVYMKKVLDSLRLPGGVLVPMVDDAATAERVVQSTRYPLEGIRGCAASLVRGSAYGHESQNDYLRQCRDDLLVMVQVETPAGVKAIPEIAAVDGVDAIFLGPLDLSASIGKMGDFRDHEFMDMLSWAEREIRDSDECLLAGFRAPGRDLEDMFNKGYSLVCGSVDIGLLKEAARQDVMAGNKAMKKSK